MDEATREALTAQFRAYLDAVPDDSDDLDDSDDVDDLDDDPDGPDAQTEDRPAPDLFSLFTELSALKNEVKLESRQVKTALDEFRGLFDSLRESHTRLNDETERRCEQTRAADRAGWRDMLLELLDLRDRLHAGQDQAERFRPNWFSRNDRAPRLIVSLAEGMGMNLRRLDETLMRRGVRPIPTLGRLFDPHRMHAAEMTRNSEYRNGEVLAELRPGWLLHDELLRAAEVVVNRVDSPSQNALRQHSPKQTESSL